MALLEASGIGKDFGETHVLKDISLTWNRARRWHHRFVRFRKTTLLRCLNFLERPDTGVIKVNGETMWTPPTRHPAGEREVRKAPALRAGVPELQPVPAVYGIAERDAGQGAAGQGAPGLQGQQKQAIHAQLEQQAKGLRPRWVCRSGRATTHQLSGGQQRGWPLRAPDPAPGYPLLSDEPTGALDPSRPARCCAFCGTWPTQDHHDHRDPRDELCRDVADRILFMDGGVVVEQRPGRQLIEHPGRAHPPLPGPLFRIKSRPHREARPGSSARGSLFVSIYCASVSTKVGSAVAAFAVHIGRGLAHAHRAALFHQLAVQGEHVAGVTCLRKRAFDAAEQGQLALVFGQAEGGHGPETAAQNEHAGHHRLAGKCPQKNSSLRLTHLRPMAHWPGRSPGCGPRGKGVAVGAGSPRSAHRQRVGRFAHRYGSAMAHSSHLRRAMRALCPPKPRLLLSA